MRRTTMLLPVTLLAFAGATAAEGITLQNKSLSLAVDARVRAAYVERSEFSDTNDGTNDRFFLERTWLGVRGNVYENLSYELVWELRGYKENGGSIEGQNLQILYQARPDLLFHFGQFKVPIGRKFLVRWYRRDSFALPAVAGSFLPGRDIGVLGEYVALENRLMLRAGVFTGNGMNQKYDDAAGKKLYVARVDASPLGALASTEGDFETTAKPRVAVGASFASSEDAGPPPSGAEYLRTIDGTKNLVQADAAAKYRGMFIGVEWARGFFDPSSGDDFEAGGFLAEASYYMPALKLQPRVMYDEFDPRDHAGSDKKKTWTYGVNILLHGHDAKVMVEYVDYMKLDEHDAGGWASDEMRFSIQLTAI